MGKKIKQSGTEKASPRIELLLGEKMFLLRKRLGLNQNRMAERIKVSSHNYKLIEYDILTPEDLEKETTVDAIEPHELCMILRRRFGIKQAEVAKKMKLCRNWFRQMETGKINCHRLLAFWDSYINNIK